MALKEMTEKAKARMYFKRHKIGMKLAPDEVKLVKKYFPFMRNSKGSR